ncbi:hypothetical protein I5535_19840 [Rhodobacteraceae bacterium F11138]|nr:hypothetical protein [Rhodobacteraceae bacterium F11138]
MFGFVRQRRHEVIDMGPVERGQVGGQHDRFWRQGLAFGARLGQVRIHLVQLRDDRRRMGSLLDGLQQVCVPVLQLKHILVVEAKHLLSLLLLGL